MDSLSDDQIIQRSTADELAVELASCMGIFIVTSQTRVKLKHILF